ncbi:MAG: PAS domain-containing protein, partial [Nitrospiraceae bacterium]
MRPSRILIVDDDPHVLLALADMISMRLERATVDRVESAPAALERIVAIDYDVIVTDFLMPGMDGLALMAQVKKLRPYTPMLLLSGQVAHAGIGSLTSPYAFVPKPVDRDRFTEQLRYEIAYRRLARRIEAQNLVLERSRNKTKRLVQLIKDTTAKHCALLALQKQALTTSELGRQQITSILESITDGFVAFDKTWRVVYINQEAERQWFTLTPKEKLLDRNIWEAYPALMGSRFHDEFHRAMAQRVTVRFEGHYPALGSWYDVRAYPSEDGLSVYFQNITVRKEAEAKLEFQASLLNAVEQAVIVTEPDGTIIYWNRFAESLYGWTAREVIGRNVLDVTSAPGSHDEAVQIMDCLRQGDSWSGEFPVKRQDASTFTAMVTVSPIRDATGALMGIIGVSSDLTDRKRAEHAVRVAKQEQQVIFDSVPAMIWYKDAKNRIVRLNKPAADSIGARIQDLVGKSTYDVYPDEAAKCHQDDLDVIRTGVPKLGIIEPYRVASGDKRWIRTDRVPYRDQDGHIIGVIVFAVDIT